MKMKTLRVVAMDIDGNCKGNANLEDGHDDHLEEDGIGGALQVGLALNLEQGLSLRLLTLCKRHCRLVLS